MTTSLTAPICFEVSSQASLLCVWVVSQGLLPNNSCVCVLVQADKESLFEYIAYIYIYSVAWKFVNPLQNLWKCE